MLIVGVDLRLQLIINYIIGYKILTIMIKLNLTEVRKLERKANAEAQKAIDAVYAKYSKLIIEELAKALPPKTKLLCGNGITTLMKGSDELLHGNAWSIYNNGNKQMEYLSHFQYKSEIRGGLTIPLEIKSKNK